eukprot:TRINITY_DN3349_c0_g1_i2.p1 TRINITY_DN3349_c0_g1~~TRINITY_DN3349_c0_g1_i2.p1  ORF type:complete len:165 (-),score=40.20 TRINITY_DN3349_c0_g1_i2:436-903(-)
MRTATTREPARRLATTAASRKYDHIQSTLDTGASLSKHLKKVESDILSKRKGENFTRISAKKLGRMIEDERLVLQEMVQAPVPRERSDMQFLLLDIRTKDDFEQCHICFGSFYPPVQLSKAVNALTLEVLAFVRSFDLAAKLQWLQRKTKKTSIS